MAETPRPRCPNCPEPLDHMGGDPGYWKCLNHRCVGWGNRYDAYPRPSVVSGAPSDTTMTLQQVAKLSGMVVDFIAFRHGMDNPTREALVAVQELTRLARHAIGKPSDEDLRWALLNDPMCATAYQHGFAAARRSETPERP